MAIGEPPRPEKGKEYARAAWDANRLAIADWRY
jgi:hypothetical protein